MSSLESVDLLGGTDMLGQPFGPDEWLVDIHNYIELTLKDRTWQQVDSDDIVHAFPYLTDQGKACFLPTLMLSAIDGLDSATANLQAVLESVSFFLFTHKMALPLQRLTITLFVITYQDTFGLTSTCVDMWTTDSDLI